MLTVLLILMMSGACILAQSTAFIYQGQLKDGGNPANGNYDLSFALHSVASGSAPVGSIIYIDDKAVANGLFTVEVDFNFGAISFNGADRWLEIGVRAGSVSNSVRTGYIALTPRQKIMPTPYAVMSQNSAKLGGREAAEYLTASTDNWVNTTGDDMTGALNITGSAEELVKSTNSHASGAAVSGTASGADGIGGKFYGTGTNGRGVYTYTSAPNAWAIEAFAEGEGTSVAGRFDAVGGNNSKAVEGVAGNDGAVTNYGGHFTAEGNMGEGVYGKSSGANGIGVHGEVNGVNALGGSFSSTGTNGRGVYTYTSAANAWALEAFAEGEGSSIGGRFETSGATGKAIEGIAGNDAGTLNYGGYFRSDGVNGQAIFGEATAANGKALVVNHKTSGNYAHLGASQYAGYFNGPVSTNSNYTFSTPKTFHLQVPTAAFTEGYSKSDFFNNGNGYIVITGNAEELATYRVEVTAPVNLPQGATVTEFVVYYYDNTNTQGWTVEADLWRRPILGTAQSAMASISVTTTEAGQSSSILTTLDNTIANSQIDNQYYQYSIYVILDSDQAYSSHLRFYGCRITYTLGTLQP